MWDSKNKNSADIIMTEGDFGIYIPITVEGLPISSEDTLRIRVKTEKNGEPLIEKEVTADDEFTIELEWTEEESALLTPGNYIYILDWFSEGEFMCTIINGAKLKVEDKA